MDVFEMEEFMQLEDVWAQTFDVSHFDDLEVTEAKDGLHGFSFKPKPQADVQVDLLEDLLDSPVGGRSKPIFNGKTSCCLFVFL